MVPKSSDKVEKTKSWNGCQQPDSSAVIIKWCIWTFWLRWRSSLSTCRTLSSVWTIFSSFKCSSFGAFAHINANTKKQKKNLRIHSIQTSNYKTQSCYKDTEQNRTEPNQIRNSRAYRAISTRCKLRIKSLHNSNKCWHKEKTLVTNYKKRDSNVRGREITTTKKLFKLMKSF